MPPADPSRPAPELCPECRGEGRILVFYDRPGGPPGNGYRLCSLCAAPPSPTGDGAGHEATLRAIHERMGAIDRVGGGKPCTVHEPPEMHCAFCQWELLLNASAALRALAALREENGRLENRVLLEKNEAELHRRGEAALRQRVAKLEQARSCGTCGHRGEKTGSCMLDVLDPHGEHVEGAYIKNWRNRPEFGCRAWETAALA